MDKDTGNNGEEKNYAYDDMRPGFLGGAGGGEMQYGLNKENPGAGKDGGKARDELASAEKAAEEAGANKEEKTDGGIKNSVTGARQNEEEAGGLYKGSGKKVMPKTRASRFRGVAKKGGPLFAILSSVFIVGGIMMGTQFFQPFSIVAQFQETFGSMEKSANVRSEAFFRYQMANRQTKNPIKRSIFGKKFSISEKQAAELKKQGIEFDEDFNGVKVLKFEGEDGNMKIITASEGDAASLRNGGADAVEFKKFYADNPKFFTSYNKGSMTWRGAIANWFGTNTVEFLRRNKLTRNLFADYKNKASGATDVEARTKVATEMMDKGTDEIGGGGVRRSDVVSEWSETENIGGADGEQRQYEKVVDETVMKEYSGSLSWFSKLKNFIVGIFTGGDSEPEADFDHSEKDESFDKFNRSDLGEVGSEDNIEKVKSKLKGIANKFTNGSAGTASTVANYSCLGVNVLGAITLLVQASEAMQTIKLATGYFEAFDKAKAGYGAESPINELMTTLNEKKKNEYDVLTSTGTGVGNVTEDGIASLTTVRVSSEKTAMNSQGVGALYSPRKIDTSDPSVQSFNFSGNVKRIMGGIGANMDMFKACSIARISAAAVDLATGGLEVAGCLAGLVGAAFTLGTSAVTCAPIIGKMAIAKIGFSIAAGLLVSGIVASVAPVVARLLTRNLIADIGGEDLGNALASGANIYLGNTHRSNGGSLATREKYEKFAVLQNQVIAEKAKLERESLSPFDLTSKYTFMGSLMTHMMSFGQSDTLMGLLRAGGSVVSSSLVGLTPTASAYDVVSFLPDESEWEDTCPYLASIGAVGDAFCNPYAATDVETIEIDPQDIIDHLADPDGDKMSNDSNFEGKNEGEEEEDGEENSEEENEEDEEKDLKNVEIKKGSKLYNYIIYCDNRESGFGIADQNIANAVTGTASLNAMENSIIGSMPVIGEVVDIFDNAKQIDNLGYISGESCVAGNKVNNNEAPDWEEAKYYQRFIEDQSLAESMGVIEKSAVTVALEEYYKDNPLDDSYEGMLARYSGLEKEDVIALLDAIEYYDYIAKYDPSTRYAFNDSKIKIVDSKGILFEHEYVLDGEVVLIGRIVYADVRNRSYAA